MDVVLVAAEYIIAAACGAAAGVTVQFQPVVAAGIVTTPDEAEPPVPTFILKVAVPLLAVIEGEVPKPLDIVGATLDIRRAVSVIVVNLAVLGVVPPIAPGAANVAPFSDEQLRLATFVVLATVKGAVPVA